MDSEILLSISYMLLAFLFILNIVEYFIIHLKLKGFQGNTIKGPIISIYYNYKIFRYATLNIKNFFWYFVFIWVLILILTIITFIFNPRSMDFNLMIFHLTIPIILILFYSSLNQVSTYFKKLSNLYSNNKNEINKTEIFDYLMDLKKLIVQIDFYRPHDFKLNRYLFLEPYMVKKSFSEKYDNAIKAVNKNLFENFEEIYNILINKKEIRKHVAIFILFMIILAFLLIIILDNKFMVSDIQMISLAIIIGVSISSLIIIFYMGIIRFYAINELAQEKNEMLKSMSEEVINIFKEILLKFEMTERDFPIELLHNDYENLIYEEKGKNRFIAYVRL
jgi:hypothetical protein